MRLAKWMIGKLADARTERGCAVKLRRIRRNLGGRAGRLEKGLAREYRALWRPFGGKPDTGYPAVCAFLSGVNSHLYVPEPLYYRRIEPVLNNRAFSLACSDKNGYERLFREGERPLPETFLRGMDGVPYSAGFEPVPDLTLALASLPADVPLVLKPSVDSAGGAGVVELIPRPGSAMTVNGVLRDAGFVAELLEDRYRPGFVIQEKVRQHPWFASFNESSVNTVRMVTYRSVADERVHLLKAVVRFGRKGSLVDNQASGGFSCGILDDGRVRPIFIDKYGTRGRLQPPQSGVPGFQAMLAMAKDLAAKFPYHRLLGFDFCVDSDQEVRLLEINTKNLEINFLQMNLGPLFGEHTGEVADFCAGRRRTMVLDFEV